MHATPSQSRVSPEVFSDVGGSLDRKSVFWPPAGARIPLQTNDTWAAPLNEHESQIGRQMKRLVLFVWGV